MSDLSQSEREALAMAERPTGEQEAMVAACDASLIEWSRSPEAVERLREALEDISCDDNHDVIELKRMARAALDATSEKEKP